MPPRRYKEGDPLNPQGPELTAEQRAGLRTLQASLRQGLAAMYDEYSTEAGWRMRLKMPGKFHVAPVMLAVYCVLMLADSALNFGQRIVDLEEEGDDIVFSSLTARQYFWLLFAIRVVVTIPVMLLAGYGESYNLVLRRYEEMYSSYVAVCERLGDPPAVDRPHAVLTRVAAREQFQGTICMVTTVLVNAMAETVLDCVLNLMAIHFLTNLDEWAENNVANNGHAYAGRWLNPANHESLHKYRYNKPADAERWRKEKPTDYMVDCYLNFWDVEKVETS